MRHLPRPCLVDTNVAIVANGKSRQADESLVEDCIDAILEVTSNEHCHGTRCSGAGFPS